MFFGLKPEFKIFDSRKGDDYVESTRSGVPFSIQEYDFLVVRYRPFKIPPSQNQPEFDAFIRRAMESTGVRGVFSISDLSPPLKAALPPAAENVVEELGAVMGYFPLESKLINQFLDLKNVVSWEVVIVGSVQKHVPNPIKGWGTYPYDIDLFLGDPSSLGCLTRFDGETETLEVFTKIYDGIDQQLAILLNGSKK
jgi:hypothetical protein